MKTVDLNDKPAFLALSYSWKQDESWASLFAIGNEHIIRNRSWNATQDFRAMLGQRDSVSSDERDIKSMEILRTVYSEDNIKESWKQTIFCDGKSITIQQNLYNALLYLRKGRPGDYWIDAVCIDQENVHEKSLQVQMMGKIYRSATGVVVWLGNVPVLLDEGMQKLSQKLATCTGSSPPRFSEEDLGEIDKLITQLAMVWLLTRRWFRRLWVVQESCLAQQIAFILGDYEFSPGAISCILRWAEELSLDRNFAMLTMPVLPWNTQIKRAPAMLASNQFLQSGGRWTLRDWLDATTARKASDPRDIVFAGLALLDVQSLVIDQDLQLPEEQSVLQSLHQRLWQVLHADYDVEPPFVLLNLAACILSHWDFNLLFAYALRYRPPPNATCTVSETPLYPQASWIPDPSRWSSRELQPGFMLSGLKRPLPVLNDADYPRPRISADGTTLFMAAARFDEITQHFSLLGFVDKPERMMIDGVNWISRFIPRVYLPTGKPGLKTLVNVAMSKYRMKREPVGATFEPFLYFMFCQLLDSWLQAQISNEKNAWFPFAFLHAAKVPGWLPFFGADKAESLNTNQSETAHTELRKSHPDAPWPEHVDKPPAKKDSDCNSEQHPGFAHQLAEMVKELTGLKHSTHKPPAESGDGIKENVLFDLMKHYCEDLNMQSIFVTKQGYIGIGPNGLQDGDSVFLIANGNAPYVLAHIDDVLRRRAREIRNKIDSRADAVAEDKLRKDLVDVEDRIGKRDGYQLVGEAYVEGVMNGEIADQVRDKMKKYSLL
jgi:hypothetical protein